GACDGLPVELKTGLIDEVRAQDLSIGDLEGVALSLVVEAGRYQVERTDARVLDVYGLKNVAQRKCVAGRQLIIDSRADGDPSLWNSTEDRKNKRLNSS